MKSSEVLAKITALEFNLSRFSIDNLSLYREDLRKRASGDSPKDTPTMEIDKDTEIKAKDICTKSMQVIDWLTDNTDGGMMARFLDMAPMYVLVLKWLDQFLDYGVLSYDAWETQTIYCQFRMIKKYADEAISIRYPDLQDRWERIKSGAPTQMEQPAQEPKTYASDYSSITLGGKEILLPKDLQEERTCEALLLAYERGDIEPIQKDGCWGLKSKFYPEKQGLLFFADTICRTNNVLAWKRIFPYGIARNRDELQVNARNPKDLLNGTDLTEKAPTKKEKWMVAIYEKYQDLIQRYTQEAKANAIPAHTN